MKFSVIIFSLLLFSFNGCSSLKSTASKPSPFINQTLTENNQLKILSWNIKMFPGPYGWFLNCSKRAENIIHFINESDPYDIIFFQEAFSESIRKNIYEGLKNIYPYNIEPDDHTVFYKLNSGLWVISRLPISQINHISFTNNGGSDKLASKGAKLFSIIKDKREFNLIHTHMQSDYKTQFSDVRTHQYTEINDKLILPIEKKRLPLILIGDLNISKAEKLQFLLQKLNLQNGPLIGKLQHSIISGSKNLVDYILVRENHIKFKSIQRRVIDISNKLHENKYNLSDHYPLEAVFIW